MNALASKYRSMLLALSLTGSALTACADGETAGPDSPLDEVLATSRHGSEAAWLEVEVGRFENTGELAAIVRSGTPEHEQEAVVRTTSALPQELANVRNSLPEALRHEVIRDARARVHADPLDVLGGVTLELMTSPIANGDEPAPHQYRQAVSGHGMMRCLARCGDGSLDPENSQCVDFCTCMYTDTDHGFFCFDILLP